MPGVRAPVRARVAAGGGGVSRIVDLLIVGGGINGAAIARDAAGRGIATYLAEQRDYASGTSSASSKLIHGGLRYLEHGEFRLVRQSLREREVLMRLAPHLVRPLRFLVPITRGQPKPAWMVRTGLWLYDRLAARRALAPSGRLRAAEADAVPHLRRQGLRAVLHYPRLLVRRRAPDPSLPARCPRSRRRYRQLSRSGADSTGIRRLHHHRARVRPPDQAAGASPHQRRRPLGPSGPRSGRRRNRPAAKFAARARQPHRDPRSGPWARAGPRAATRVTRCLHPRERRWAGGFRPSLARTPPHRWHHRRTARGPVGRRALRPRSSATISSIATVVSLITRSHPPISSGRSPG